MQRPLDALPARTASRGVNPIVRVLLLAFWALALWGALLDLTALWMLVTLGVGAAWRNIQGLSAVNVLLGVLAPFVWGTVAWTLALRQRGD